MADRTLRFLVGFGVLALFAQGALAQQESESEAVAAALEPTEVESASEDADEALTEEIVVTGSRIRRDTFSSTSPITVITGERSALAGLLDTADILQGSTIASGQQIDDSFSGFVTDGGPGANTLSLRGLGAQRTLILVNGRRWGPSGVRGATNSVDLTAIPSSIVSRIEILKDGASSIYGADAVAGVVNVITKTRQDAFQVNVSGALPGRGGGEAYGVDAVWGKVGSDWSFNLSGAWYKQEQLVRTQRDWAACDTRPRLTDQDGDNPGGSPDNRDPATGEELCFGAIYGFAVSPFGFARYDSSLGPGADPSTPGYDPLINGAFGIPYFTRMPATALDNENAAFYRDTRSPSISQMVSNSERFSITGYADKDLDLFGQTANTFLEFYFNRRETESTGGYRQFFPVVPGSSVSNPFGAHGPLAAINPAGFAAQPVIMTYGFEDPENKVEVNRINVFAGIDGDFNARWGYNAHVGYSWSEGEYGGEAILDDRANAALNTAYDTDGNLVCASNEFPGCVPIQPFTEEALLNGTLPADAVDFIVRDILGNTVYKSLQFSGYASGSLFDLFGTESVSLAIGGEVRREEIDDQPDEQSQAGNLWGSSSAVVTAGKDTVKEAFFELEAPLLPPGTPMAEEVLLNLAARYTDYNSYGDDWTERAQLSWQVNSLIRLRGTYGTSFRAPDLFEQFLGDQTGFLSGLADPCVNYGENSQPGDPVYDNCASLGLPPDLGNEGAPGITAITGGNANLLAETSDAWTAGVVLTPEQLGLSVSLNFFEIELENTVSRPSVGYILGQCYTSQGLTNAFCSRIGPRDDMGFLTGVDASFLNIGIERTKGYDLDVLYEKTFSRFDLAIDFSATYLDEQYLQLFEEEYELDGRWGYPEWTAELDFYVDWRDWRFLWAISYVGHTREERVFDPDTTNVDRIRRTPSKDFHTLSARYTSPNDWQVIATVRNLFDTDPPIVSDGQGSNSATRIFNTIPGAGYELLGRMFILQVSRQF